jgi:DNA-binding NtrC family response regulator
MIFDTVSRHQSGVLSGACLKEYIQQKRSGENTPLNPPGAATGDPAFATGRQLIFTDSLPTLKEAEQLLVEEALRRAKNNQSIASGMLGITRSALNKRLNQKETV